MGVFGVRFRRGIYGFYWLRGYIVMWFFLNIRDLFFKELFFNVV